MTSALLLAGLLPACSSPCVEAGNQIQVTVNGGANLNDAGAGAQHARFKVWAVKSAGAFDSASASKLATGEVDAVALNQIGRMFPSDSNWLTPGGVRTVMLAADQDDQYTHVGVAILYPTAQTKLTKLCTGAAKKEDGVHRVVFDAGKTSIETGAAK